MSALQASALGWTSDATERRIAPTGVMRKIVLWFTGQKKVTKGFLDKKLLRDASYNQLLTPIPVTEDLVKVNVDIDIDHVDDIDIDLPDLHPYHGVHHQVNVTISIVDIMEIDELAEKFTIKFNFQRDWFDHRLTYLNLKVKGMIVL